MQLNKWQLMAIAGVVSGAVVGAYHLGRHVQRKSQPRTEYHVLDVAAMNADLVQKLGNVNSPWRQLGVEPTAVEREATQAAQQLVASTELEMRTRTTNAVNKLLAEGWIPDGDVESGRVTFHRRVD